MGFRLNEDGVGAVVKSRECRAALEEFGEEIGDEVKRQAERLIGTGPHGRFFARSVAVTDAVETSSGIAATVHSPDHLAHIFEWGSVTSPALAPFRKAASELGLDLKAGGRS